MGYRRELILVRATCEQRAKALSLKQAKLVKRKSVDPFNASRSRQPRLPLNKKTHHKAGLFIYYNFLQTDNNMFIAIYLTIIISELS